MRRTLVWLGIALGVAVMGIQLVPYGGRHVNPPITAEPPWDRPQTRALAVRACFDCHSNETVWPWYAHVAPLSWLIQRDVEDGRRTLNYSEWDRDQRDAHESAETVRKGEMPPWFYALPATRARLSAADRGVLAAGLDATFDAEHRIRRDKTRHD